jgi:hypothetical protein
MYSAIVFLPLIGAVIAGLIVLFGARITHPGGAAMPPTVMTMTMTGTSITTRRRGPVRPN